MRDLESINKSLKYYKDTYNSLDTWIQQVEDTQRKIQEIHPENSKALAKQLNQHKVWKGPHCRNLLLWWLEIKISVEPNDVSIISWNEVLIILSLYCKNPNHHQLLYFYVHSAANIFYISLSNYYYFIDQFWSSDLQT